MGYGLIHFRPFLSCGPYENINFHISYFKLGLFGSPSTYQTRPSSGLFQPTFPPIPSLCNPTSSSCREGDGGESRKRKLKKGQAFRPISALFSILSLSLSHIISKLLKGDDEEEVSRKRKLKERRWSLAGGVYQRCRDLAQGRTSA